MFYPAETDSWNPDPRKSNQLKTMKTKLTQILSTVTIAAALTSTAFAGKPFARVARGSAPASGTIATNCCASGGVCVAKDCCAVRLVATPALSGKGSHTGFKRVRHCASACPVPVDKQRAVCGSGKRA